MARTDSTLVLRAGGEIVGRATFSLTRKWTLRSLKVPGGKWLDEETKRFQRFTDSEQKLYPPGAGNGDPLAALVRRAATEFGWDVEHLEIEFVRKGIVY